MKDWVANIKAAIDKIHRTRVSVPDIPEVGIPGSVPDIPEVGTPGSVPDIPEVGIPGSVPDTPELRKVYQAPFQIYRR